MLLVISALKLFKRKSLKDTVVILINWYFYTEGNLCSQQMHTVQKSLDYKIIFDLGITICAYFLILQGIIYSNKCNKCV